VKIFCHSFALRKDNVKKITLWSKAMKYLKSGFFKTGRKCFDECELDFFVLFWFGATLL